MLLIAAVAAAITAARRDATPYRDEVLPPSPIALFGLLEKPLSPLKLRVQPRLVTCESDDSVRRLRQRLCTRRSCDPTPRSTRVFVLQLRRVAAPFLEATGTGGPLQNTRSQTHINKAIAALAPTNEKGKKVVEVEEENEDEGEEEYNSNASESDGFQQHNDLDLEEDEDSD
ncbi:hypothetical protein JHK87_001054 [Glycine soja]|nr:hypothetical protein JHK87_001054 [Glycine soja]